MKKIIFILIFFNSFVLNAQYKFYTSFSTGLQFHSVKNKEDANTTDFVLQQKTYRFGKNKFNSQLHFQLGYLINKHLGAEIGFTTFYINKNWWLYDTNNRNFNRQLVTGGYIFPLSLHCRSNISKRYNYSIYGGVFFTYIPNYTIYYSSNNENINVPDRLVDEMFKGLKGTLSQFSDTGNETNINYTLNKPLITKFQFGYTGGIQFGYNINSRLNLFLQFQIFTTLSDLENKKSVTMTRTFDNGTKDVVTLNYYSNMYKQFFTRDPNDINKRPKTTFTILNSELGLKFCFGKRKNDEFIIHY